MNIREEETTINIQDLFNERNEQNKRITELVLKLEKQKEIIDKIKKELEEPDTYGVDEDGYDDAYYDKIYVRRIEELLEEIE